MLIIVKIILILTMLLLYIIYFGKNHMLFIDYPQNNNLTIGKTKRYVKSLISSRFRPPLR